VIGVFFNVLNIDGSFSEQVFERSELFRWIATHGNLQARRNVSHPTNQQFVFWPSAWNLARLIPNELQSLLARERLALGLVLHDDNPLFDED
jgi:hypothetical protein